MSKIQVYSPKLSKYILWHGTKNQKERVEAGIALPDSEVDEIVYKTFWTAYFGWYKRKRMTDDEVRKIAVMHRMANPDDPVSFEVVEPADELTDMQWTALKAIKKIGEVFNARVTPFWVIGHCGRKHLKKTYSRVEFEIDERPYRVELCLELPNHPDALARALELAKQK